MDGSLGCGDGIIARRQLSLFFVYKSLTAVRGELPAPHDAALRIDGGCFTTKGLKDNNEE